MWLALKRMLILVDTFGRHRPMMIKKINRRIMTKSVKERRRRRILAKTCNLARVRTAFSRQRLQRGLDFIRINEICLVYIWELSTSVRLACALALVSLHSVFAFCPQVAAGPISVPLVIMVNLQPTLGGAVMRKSNHEVLGTGHLCAQDCGL